MPTARGLFKEWGERLSEVDFYRALAVIGITTEPASPQLEPLLWALPKEPLPPPDEARARWKTLQEAFAPGQPMLAIVDGEWVHEFKPYIPAVHWELQTAIAGDPVWRWPVRIAFGGDEASRALAESWTAERRGHETLRTLTVDPESTSAAGPCEFLILAGPPESAIAQTLSQPVPRQPSCIVLLGAKDSASYVGLAPQLLALTAASGVLFLPGPTAPQIGELIWDLSHNNPLSAAVTGAFLAGSRSLVRKSRISTFFRETAEGFLARKDNMVRLSDEVARVLNFTSSWARSDTLANLMFEALRRPEFTFDQEIHGATAAVKLAQELGRGQRSFYWGGLSGSKERGGPETIRPAVPPPAPRPPLPAAPIPPRPPERFVQVDWRQDQKELDLLIGPPTGESIQADEAFPDDLLPDDDEPGHLLTIVVTEPRLLKEPLVQTLYLPRAGASARVTFSLPGEDVDARITILFNNRILQTLRFSPGRLRVEMPVRPGWHNLSQTRPADLSFVLNHSSDGVPRATGGGGYRFATFELTNLEGALSRFETKINSVPWADADYQSLETEGTVDLLRYLAANGAGLYQHFLTYLGSQIPEARIKAARYIQVVSRDNGARLPIEFFYDRKPPRRDATLCPDARRVLESGAAACTCTDDDGSTVCPFGFWAFRKVIENHHFTPEAAQETEGRAYALRDQPPGERPAVLPLAHAILWGASAKMLPESRTGLGKALAGQFPEASHPVKDWDDWTAQVAEFAPGLLLLLPHTGKDEFDMPQMEINGQWQSGLDLTREFLLSSTTPPPIVILLGCNTDNAGLGHENFVPRLSGLGAAIVVSSVSKVLGRHAAPLAAMLVEMLAARADASAGDSTFGEAMLAVRRRALLNGPACLVLKSYGDADWRI